MGACGSTNPFVPPPALHTVYLGPAAWLLCVSTSSSAKPGGQGPLRPGGYPEPGPLWFLAVLHPVVPWSACLGAPAVHRRTLCGWGGWGEVGRGGAGWGLCVPCPDPDHVPTTAGGAADIRGSDQRSHGCHAARGHHRGGGCVRGWLLSPRAGSRTVPHRIWSQGAQAVASFRKVVTRVSRARGSRRAGWLQGTVTLPWQRDDIHPQALSRTDWMPTGTRTPPGVRGPTPFPRERPPCTVHSPAQVATGLCRDWPSICAGHCALGEGNRLPSQQYALAGSQRRRLVPGTGAAPLQSASLRGLGLQGKWPSPHPHLLSIPPASLWQRGRERPCTYWGFGFTFFFNSILIIFFLLWTVMANG